MRLSARPLALLAVAAAPALGIALRADAQTIDTRSSWVTHLTGGSGTMGQSFTVPEGANLLKTFSFWIGGPTYDPYTYHTLVYAFSRGRAVGPALFVSDVRVADGFPPEFQPPQVFAPEIAVTRGGQYVALVQRIGSNGSYLGFATFSNSMGLFPSTYSGGGAYYATLLDPALNLDPTAPTATWNALIEGTNVMPNPSDNTVPDLSFVAAFGTTMTPEPGTALLAGAGLLVIGEVARRRRA